MRFTTRAAMTAAALLATGLLAAAPATAGGNKDNPRNDADGNGVPDAGKVVTGTYSMEWYGCDYQVQYRGDFGNDPYLDSGWIHNSINCGEDGRYTYLIVHETDPRFDGDPDRSIWGTWEVHTETWSGYGNVANPMHPQYAYGS